MRFKKSEIAMLRIEMQEALDKVAKKHNAKVNIDRITFGLEAATKITISRVSTDEYGEFTLTKEAQELKNRLPRMGLRADVLNEPFVYKGDKIIIKGYNTRARRYPIEYTIGTKNYKCSVEYMKKMVKDNRPELFL